MSEDKFAAPPLLKRRPFNLDEMATITMERYMDMHDQIENLSRETAHLRKLQDLLVKAVQSKSLEVVISVDAVRDVEVIICTPEEASKMTGQKHG